MGYFYLQTVKSKSARCWETNSTDTSFSQKLPTTTEPTGEGIFEPEHNLTLLMPYGTDGENETFDMRVYGWTQINSLWIPARVFSVTCTLAALTLDGVAGEVVDDDDIFCDTIASLVGDSDVKLVSNGDSDVSYLIFDHGGFRKLEIDFDRVTAASCNALRMHY